MTRTKNKHLFDDTLCFKLTGGQYLLLEVQDLLYIEADREISYLNLVNGDRIATAHHLGYYKFVLLSRFGFLEASKSVLVNTTHVVRYRMKERTLQLTSGADVVVANSKKEMVSEIFKKMCQRWEAGKTDVTDTTSPKTISFGAEF
ncbi:MAG: LytTR family transcriptional regulator DNA-binding domain-containing protein [Saprospiraceae bacterium]|nr:LytTR family transcriptional regulator DNA-binding domain-containing protein [Saprospiraceae bacterium]